MAPRDNDCLQQFTFDTTPSAAVVGAVAWVTDDEVTARSPINDVIDTEALDALVDSATDADLTVTFSYEEYEVTIVSDGNLYIGATSDSVCE